MILNSKSIIFSCCFLLFIFLTSRAEALTLSPVRIELSGDPGSVLYSKVKILNENEEKIKVYKTTEGFEGEGETGVPKLNGSTDGLPSWINTQDYVEIESGKVEEIPVAVVIPKDVEPGGYYGALCWGDNAPSVNENVSIGARICSIILVNVLGNVKEGGGVLEYSLFENKNFYTALPVSFVYRLQNTGNGLIKPEGEILIRNFLRMKVVGLNANPVDGNVLPRGGIRKYQVVWSKDSTDYLNVNNIKGFWNHLAYQWKNFAFGYFTADLSINFGVEKEIKEIKRVSFWVVPWQLILVVLLLLFISYKVLRKSIHYYNSWVIKQAEQAIKKEMSLKKERTNSSRNI